MDNIVEKNVSSATGTPFPIAKGALRPNGGKDICRWIAKLDGEPETDSPKSVHPAIRECLRATVDADFWLGEQHRSVHCQPLVASARGSVASDPRVIVYGLIDYAVRVAWPTCLESAGLVGLASEFREIEPIASLEQVFDLQTWLDAETTAIRKAHEQTEELLRFEGEESWVIAQGVHLHAVKLLESIEDACDAAFELTSVSEGRIVHMACRAAESAQHGLQGGWLTSQLMTELHQMAAAFLAANRAALAVRSGQLLVRASLQLRLCLNLVMTALDGAAANGRVDAQVKIASRLMGILRTAVTLRDTNHQCKGKPDRKPMFLGENWCAYLNDLCLRAKRVSPAAPAANSRRAPAVLSVVS